MDINHGTGRVPPSSPTRPLRVRKENSQTRVARSRQPNSNQQSNPATNPTYPPRTSSLRRYNDPDASSRANREKNHRRQKSDNSSTVRSTPVRTEWTSTLDTSIGGSSSTALSIASNHKEHYLSDSSKIIGDFVPLESSDMALPLPKAENNRSFSNAATGLIKVKHVVNPYEFEPGTPYVDDGRQTTISDFMDGNNAVPSPNTRVSHMKNSRSEGNATYMIQKSTPLNISQSRPSGHSIQRSESSPRFSALQSPERHNRPLSQDLSAYYGQDEESPYQTRRGRTESRITYVHSSQYQDGNGIPSRRAPLDSFANENLRSPTRLPSQKDGNRSPPKSNSPNRHLTRSPTKVLDDVSECNEYDGKISNADPFLSPTPSSPKKRSRSPMKKMFGEHGWLGRSPDEFQVGKLQSKKSIVGRKEKTSVMGKLRTKIEELAEKADLSPISKGSRSHEKHPKISVLSVSLGPPEQARIYMEVELMLVHTANSFLMNQFSQGRMAMDSIKKTVDTWKARGRPIVLEFMYDQATQRDLVAVNQHNLRFYGERAGDSVRINATLYNWKQVASLMAIRTFCDADTVILKLLFDIEQILELLGAREPILLRLQQIRASVNEMMRVARQKAQNKAGQREPTWNSQSSTDCSSRSQSIDDPYGGLQLVPESYME